jgi:hypothetical protein
MFGSSLSRIEGLPAVTAARARGRTPSGAVRLLGLLLPAWLGLAVVVLGGLGWGSVSAQGVSIEEMERRLKKAQEAQARREVEERASQEVEARAACEWGETPWVMQATADAGVLRQCGGLLWTRSDNGGDVNWEQAQAHCRGLGGSWRLPTAQQLHSLYNRDLPGMSCGGRHPCKVSNQFRLSGLWFWSSEPNDRSSGAWTVFLPNGDRGVAPRRLQHRHRALCVRRP